MLVDKRPCDSRLRANLFWLAACLAIPFRDLARWHRKQCEYQNLLLDRKALKDIGAPPWMVYEGDRRRRRMETQTMR